MRIVFLSYFLLIFITGQSQLLIGVDTISVLDNNYCLKMPWAGGINAATFSNIDLNYDGKNDIVIYDKLNSSALGAFKCFVNVGNPGQTKYQHAPQLAQKFPLTYNWALLYDYNNDNKADLFCSVTGGIQVYKNIGNASSGLQFVMTYSLLYSNYNPSGAPSISNIYSGPVGLPAISDIDGDGDLDILTFSPSGTTIEFHRNLSAETPSLTPDSMKYELGNPCWGSISEGNCVVTLNYTCSSRPQKETEANKAEGVLHSGACLMAFDRDGDGDKDIILADISCTTIEYMQNDGTATNAFISDTTKLFPSYPNKSSTTQIEFNSFPCTYYMDVDDDNKKELVATPNTFGSENATSVWLYKNTSTTNTLNLQFVKNNFLQDEMIELGQMSRPIIFDANGDGKKDLLVGGGGIYLNGARRPRFYLYENIGTLAQPAFSCTTKDYGNLSSVLNGSIISAFPAPGDIDNDGDIDLFVITNGYVLSWYENTAGAGNPCNFTNYKSNFFNINFPSSDGIPQLFDFDKDNKLDLMVATKNGKIYYYHNVGTSSTPSFSLVTNAFPNIALKGDFFVYGLDGYGSPHFYNEGSTTKLLGGCVTGQLYYFDIPSIATNTCTLIDSTANGIFESTYSTPWYEDINNDGKPDLFVGNAGGGVSFYSSKAPDVGIQENSISTIHTAFIYPNPANNFVNIKSGEEYVVIKEVEVLNILSQQIKKEIVNKNEYQMNINDLPEGIYLVNVKLQANSNQYTITKKLIKR